MGVQKGGTHAFANEDYRNVREVQWCIRCERRRTPDRGAARILLRLGRLQTCLGGLAAAATPCGAPQPPRIGCEKYRLALGQVSVRPKQTALPGSLVVPGSSGHQEAGMLNSCEHGWTGTTEASGGRRVRLMKLDVAAAAVAWCRAGSRGTQKVPTALVSCVIKDHCTVG